MIYNSNPTSPHSPSAQVLPLDLFDISPAHSTPDSPQLNNNIDHTSTSPLHPSPTGTSSPPLPPTHSPPPPMHPMITHNKVGIFKPKAWVSQSVTDWTTIEPTRVRDALSTPQWKATMDAEYTTLLQNGTWKLVPPSPKFNVVGNKWVFKLKRNADGSIQRYKARLVAKGFQQHPRIDFFETFSQVAKASTIRVVLAITVTKGWELRHLDFNNAFLNGQLIGDVYMAQPPGYVDTRFLNYICKLEKALYGLNKHHGLEILPCELFFLIGDSTTHGQIHLSLFYVPALRLYSYWSMLMM